MDGAGGGGDDHSRGGGEGTGQGGGGGLSLHVHIPKSDIQRVCVLPARPSLSVGVVYDIFHLFNAKVRGDESLTSSESRLLFLSLSQIHGRLERDPRGEVGHVPLPRVRGAQS